MAKIRTSPLDKMVSAHAKELLPVKEGVLSVAAYESGLIAKEGITIIDVPAPEIFTKIDVFKVTLDMKLGEFGDPERLNNVPFSFLSEKIQGIIKDKLPK